MEDGRNGHDAYVVNAAIEESDTKHGLWLDCFSNIMRDCIDRRKNQKQQKHQDQQIYEQGFMIVMWFSTRIYIGI
jgi:hypothetical protein